MGARLLIVNADDYGLTPGVCIGILTAHRDGIVTSTTALAVGPSFTQHAAALRDSGLAVGAHLAVVGEDPPILSSREIPTLVDASGQFPLTWKQFIRRVIRGRIDPDDLDREFTAQVAVLRDAGLTLTHVDAHQNLHLWPTVAGRVVALADREGIGALRLTRSNAWSPRSLGVKVTSAALERRAVQASLAFTEATAGLDQAGQLVGGRLTAAIDQLAASGASSAELATHPGTAHDPERRRYRWGYHWPEELEAMCSPDTRERVQRAGFTLGTFDDLVGRG